MAKISKVLLKVENGIAYVTLNNPEKSNALDQEVKEGIAKAFREIRHDLDVRAVVVSANGKHFCGGGDIKSMEGMNTIDGRDRMRKNADWLLEIINLEKPIIAAVNGAAAGAGLSIALACDFIVAADNSKFISSFINIGLVSDNAALYFLPRRVGLSKAKQISFSGKPVRAEEALKIGLVDKVVPSEELQSAAKEIAEEFVDKPTYTLGLTKKLANISYETDIISFLDKETSYQSIIFQTDDHKNAVKSFLNKEPIVFKGK